jgi:hypothetical protein
MERRLTFAVVFGHTFHLVMVDLPYYGVPLQSILSEHGGAQPHTRDFRRWDVHRTVAAKLKPASGSRKFPQFRVQNLHETTMHAG